MTFGNLEDGIQQVELNVRKLYENDQRRFEKFEKDLPCFLSSDPSNTKVIHEEFLKNGVLKYKTECVVPKKRDGSPVPLLLLLGNPASHSVSTGMPFAYEGKKHRKEHRFWKALSEVGIISFNSPFNASSHQKRKKELHAGSYVSPFCVGLTTFYSMPSGASDKWGGVRGLYRLFGRRAMREISKYEKNRVDSLIMNLMNSRGAVFAFQKEAYRRIGKQTQFQKNLNHNAGRSPERELCDVCDCDQHVKLYSLPPTRNIQGKKALELLCTFKRKALTHA